MIMPWPIWGRARRSRRRCFGFVTIHQSHTKKWRSVCFVRRRILRLAVPERGDAICVEIVLAAVCQSCPDVTKVG